MDENDRLLLEMKRQAGLATPEEIEVLNRALVFVGGQEGGGYLVAHQPARSIDEWLANAERGVYGQTEIPLMAAGGTLNTSELPDVHKS